MTSDVNPKTVLLRGDPLAGEGTAGGAITPGMAVAVAGNAVTAASAGYAAPAFARENEIVGKGIDDAYAADDNVLYYTPRRGDWFYAFLADGENVAAGAGLACGASGALVAVASATLVARALEAVNNGTGDPVRIKVEVV